MNAMRLFRIVALFATGLIFSLVLSGYVESLEELTHPFFKYMNRWEGVEVSFERIDARSVSTDVRQHAKLSVVFPGKVRLETLGSEKPPAIRASKTNDAYQELAPHVRTFLDLYASLSSYERFAKFLKSHNVSTTPTRLDRIGKQVCLVAGATADQPDKPQLLLDKWLAAPVKLQIEDKDGASLQLNLLNWSSPLTDDRFPQTVEFVKDGVPVERWETISVKRLENPGELFTVSQKKK